MILKVTLIVIAILLITLTRYLPTLRKEIWNNMAKELKIEDAKLVQFLYNNFGKITTNDNTMELGSNFFMVKMDSLLEKKVLKNEDSFMIAPPEVINTIVKQAGFEMPKNAISFCVMDPNGKPKYTELYYNAVLSKEYQYTEVFKIPTPHVEKNMFYKKTSR